MMMIGDPLRRTHHPTVQIPSWEPYESSSDPSPHHTFSPSSDPSPHHTFSSSSHYLPVPSTDYSASDYSPSSFAADYATALNLYTSFPSDYPAAAESDSDSSAAAADLGSTLYDSFSCDEFRIYEFKVRRCVRGRSHDWTECPFAHPGEKARRRDPRRYLYSGTACPEFRKGSCKKGDACEFAHGVFECWLHPSRYRTQPCKDGVHCTRRVCFFAHSPDQLRVLPVDHQREMVISSPPVESPPVSPRGNYGEFESVGELVGAMKGLQMGCGLGKVGSPAGCWGFQLGCSPRSGGYGSSGTGYGVGVVGGSVPNTPNRGGCGPVVVSSVGGLFDDSWNLSLKEEPVMERVESGRDIRARMYAKLRRENSLDRAESPCAVPDVGWVSELVK